MNDFAAIMIHDDQHVEESKGHRGNHKEVHCSDAAHVVLEKSLPTLRRLASELGTLLPDSCRRGYQSQFGQFVSDARATPSRVGTPHLADELDQFLVLSRSPQSTSGFPSPEQPESSSLPADERFRLEFCQRISPLGPNPHEPQPKTSVRSAEPGPTRLPFEHHELMAQR